MGMESEKLFRDSIENCKRLEAENQYLKQKFKLKNSESACLKTHTYQMSNNTDEKHIAVSKQKSHDENVEHGERKPKQDKTALGITQGSHSTVMQESFTGQLQTNVAVQDDVYSMGQIRASFEKHCNPPATFPKYGVDVLQSETVGATGLSLSQVSAFPSLGTSSSNTGYKEMLQSENSLEQNNEENFLSVRVENICSALSDSDCSDQLSRIAKEIKVREKNFKDKLEENRKHETQIMLEKLESERKLKEIRDENVKLIIKIKTLERSERGAVGGVSRESMDEWVKVEQNNLPAPGKESSDRETSLKIQLQEDHIKKLSDANRKWDEQWKLLQAQYNTRIVTLQENLDSEKQKNKDIGKNQEELKKEIRTLTNALQNAQAVKLPPNYGVLEDNNKLEILKTLREDNSALKHQVSVFEEDFRRERTDRALAQSEKDELKSEYTNLKGKCHQLEKKLREVSSELKMSKENIGRLMIENEQVKLVNSELSKCLHQLKTRPEPYLYEPISPNVYNQPTMMPHYQQQPFGLNDYFSPLRNMAPNPVSQGGPQNTVAAPVNHQQGNDTVPDAWNCQWCSYANFPTRTVCEMCGKVQLPVRQTQGMQDSGQLNLSSRGPAGNFRPQKDLTGDTVCDSFP